MTAVAHVSWTQDAASTSAVAACWADLATLAACQLTGGTKYYLEAGYDAGGNDATEIVEFRFRCGCTVLAGSHLKQEPLQSACSRYSENFFYHTVFTTPACPNALTLQGKVAACNTVKITDLSAVLFDLSCLVEGTDYVFNADNDVACPTTLSGGCTWDAKASLTIPAASHDWYVRAYSNLSPGGLTTQLRARINGPSCETQPEWGREGEDTVEQLGWGHHRVYTSQSGGTVTLEAKGDTNAATHIFSSLFALNLCFFETHTVAYTEAALAVTSTGAEVMSIAHTPLTQGDTYVVGSFTYDVNETTTRRFNRCLEEGTVDFPIAWSAGVSFSNYDTADELAINQGGVTCLTVAEHNLDVNQDQNAGTSCVEDRSLTAWSLEIAAVCAGDIAVLRRRVDGY